MSVEQRDFLSSVLEGATERGGSYLGSLERSDLEDELAGRLETLDVKDAWDLAPTFVEAGLGKGELEEVADRMSPEAAGGALAWLASALAAEGSAAEVRNGTARISELVGAMREYTYLDQAPLQEVDVRRGLENSLTLLNYKLKQGVEVVRDYDPDLPPVWVSGGELNQVWTNLIDNAVDAMEGDGHLRVSTRREGDRVLVEIADDGPGIPEEAKDRIFEPFFTTKGVGEGTGLGLDIVRRIVVGQHRGDVRVESEPGNTRFQVRLPLGPVGEGRRS